MTEALHEALPGHTELEGLIWESIQNFHHEEEGRGAWDREIWEAYKKGLPLTAAQIEQLRLRPGIDFIVENDIMTSKDEVVPRSAGHLALAS